MVSHAPHNQQDGAETIARLSSRHRASNAQIECVRPHAACEQSGFIRGLGPDLNEVKSSRIQLPRVLESGAAQCYDRQRE